MTGRGLRRHLDDLLAGRRPRPFRPTPSEADELRVAIALRAARPGADEPREGFADELHARLAAELGAGAAAVAPAPDAPSPRRGTGSPAVPRAPPAARAGCGSRRRLRRGRRRRRSCADRPRGGPDGSRTITPTDGVWHTVAATAELPEGAVRAFDLGAVAGFVHRVDGVVRAVSGSCTHQGCRLALDAARNLDCPCHTTVFALSGELIRHQLPIAPRPLPTFATREVDGAVQVYAPRA